MTGGLSDQHQFEAYDGFSSLAGASWTLSLIANYIETGKIRSRGNFIGRRSVRANPMSEGSLIADFSVFLASNPAAVFGSLALTGSASHYLYGLVNRVVSRNIGIPAQPLNDDTDKLLKDKSGDVEALIAITEPSLRQTHEVIGNGANQINWVGGHRSIAHLNASSKEYMKASVPDPTIIEDEFSVTSFDGKSGNGQVFDSKLGHNIPIKMTKETLDAFGRVFSWGLHQYITKTGKKVQLKFTRILAIDGRAKKYVVFSAVPT